MTFTYNTVQVPRLFVCLVKIRLARHTLTLLVDSVGSSVVESSEDTHQAKTKTKQKNKRNQQSNTIFGSL